MKNTADGAQVFDGNKFKGEVQKVNNWGKDWLARPEEPGKVNQFFSTKTDAVFYLL